MKKNLEHGVYIKMKDMIFSYQISPGQKLQFEDLASKLGVSRTPIKNALILLEKEGFLKSIPKKGYYVAELSVKEADDLFEIREALEVTAGVYAVERAKEEDLENLRIIKEGYERSVDEELSKPRFLIDRDFHVQIGIMSKNNKLPELIKETLELIFLRHRLDGLVQKRGHRVKEEHNQIYESIKNRDVNGTVESIRYHNRKHKENIVKNLAYGGFVND